MKQTPHFLWLYVALAASPASAQPQPPVALARPVVDTYFGTKITDPYRRMPTLRNPATE